MIPLCERAHAIVHALVQLLSLEADIAILVPQAIVYRSTLLEPQSRFGDKLPEV